MIGETDLLIEADLEADDRLAGRMLAFLRDFAISGFYACACLMLGADARRAAIVAFIIFVALLLDLGRRMVMRAGLIFVPYAILFWIGIAPAPAGIWAWACR